MATYKLIQDIEAEDHILGPLSLRQFIFAIIACFGYYICFFFYTKGAWFLTVPILPVALFFTFFAFPFGRDQSTEVWALAKLRFLFKPRRRVWDQSGAKELVTITAPKRVVHTYTNGLDQDQVRSRLSALANTIDSRGWAIKNVNVNAYAQPNPMMAVSSDRLVEASSFPQEVSASDITASDDMLDGYNNPIAQQFDHMIAESAQNHRQNLINQMNSPVPQTAGQASAPANDYWFMNQAGGATAAAPTYQPHIELTRAQEATPEEEALAHKAHALHDARSVTNSHLRTLQPISAQPVPVPKPAPIPAPEPVMTAQPDAAILALASNDDLNVSTIAREASKAKREEPPHDEVIISLR